MDTSTMVRHGMFLGQAQIPMDQTFQVILGVSLIAGGGYNALRTRPEDRKGDFFDDLTSAGAIGAGGLFLANALGIIKL